MTKRLTKGTWLFVLVAVISAVAALIPLFRGRSVNVTLLVVASFWLIIAIVVANQRRAGSRRERDRTH